MGQQSLGNVTVQGVIDSKEAAVARLNRQILVGMGLLEQPSSKGHERDLNDSITRLTQERSIIAIQAYERELETGEMKAALAAIQAAEAEMDQVAAKMVTVTGYIQNANKFVGASNKVVSALKKGG